MADFDTSEFYIDTTYNFENVKKAIDDNVTVSDPNGGLTFDGNGGIDGGDPLSSAGGGGFFLGYIDGLSTFFIGDYSSDYLHYGESSGEINARFTSLEMQGSLLGPSVMTIDPAGHADDTGTLLVRGTLQVGNDNNANIVPGGKATFTEFSITDLTDEEVAYCSTDGVFYGYQFSTDNGYLDQSGVFSGVSLSLSNATIGELGLISGTGLNIGDGNAQITTAGALSCTEIDVSTGAVSLDSNGLSIGSTTISSSTGDVYVEGNLTVNGNLISGINISDLDDVTITSAASGEFLKYNGSGWENSAVDWDDLTSVPTEFPPEAHNQAWSTITSTPTTIAGYGITDAFDGAYSSLTGTPTIPTNNNQLTNGAGYATVSYVDTEISNIVISNTPAIYASGGTPYLLSGITATEIKNLLQISSTVTWDNVTSKPSTFPPEAHNQAWSTITSTPTTIAGYGITDSFSGSYNDLTDVPDPLPIDFADIQNFPSTLSAAGLSATLGDLQDVSEANAETNDVLVRLADGTYAFEDRPLSYKVNVETYTATSGQTTFSVEFAGTDKVLVHVNGILVDSSHYSEDLENQTIIFSSGVTTGDIVHLVGYSTKDDLNVVEALNDLNDVSTTGATTGQVLKKTSTGYAFADVAFSDITSKPTTLAGYGITDAATSSQGALADSAVQPNDNITTLNNNAGYITKSNLSAINNTSSTIEGGSLTYNSSTGRFTFRPHDDTKAETAYAWGDHASAGYADSTSKLSYFANVDSNTDDPDTTDLSLMYWDNTDNEWTAGVLQLDHIKNIPAPTSNGKVLTVTNYNDPEVYAWQDPGEVGTAAQAENGSWTPRFGDGSNYVNGTGWYAKAGNVVTVNFYIYNVNISNMNTGNALRIWNLPKSMSTSGDLDFFGTFRANYWSTSVIERAFLFGNCSDDRIYFMYNNNNAASANILINTLNDDTTDIWGSITYITA